MKSVSCDSDPVYDVERHPQVFAVFHRGQGMLTRTFPDCLAESALNSFTVLQRLGNCDTQVEEFVQSMHGGDGFTPMEVLWVQKGDD